MRCSLVIVTVLVMLAIPGGGGFAQDAKDCRGKEDYPSITGRWRDDGNGLEVAIRLEKGDEKSYFVTADYLTPQTCSRPRKDGSIVKIDHDFEGTYVSPKLEGTIRICYWEGEYTTSLADPDLRLTMSKDGMTLSGSYDSRDGVKQVTYTRLSKPQYDFKQWARVSLPAGTKIRSRPESGSEVRLTVSEKSDFEIISAVTNKDGVPTWYQVERSDHPVGKDVGFVRVDQVQCKKAPQANTK